MKIEEFCQKGLIENFLPIASFDDGNLRIDVDFRWEDAERDLISETESLIAHIYEASYDEILDDLPDFVEDYQLEPFEGFVYFIKCGEFSWSGYNWYEKLNNYYFDVDLLIEDVKIHLNTLCKEMKELNYEFIEVCMSGRLTQYDNDEIQSELESFIEAAMSSYEQLSLF